MEAEHWPSGHRGRGFDDSYRKPWELSGEMCLFLLVAIRYIEKNVQLIGVTTRELQEEYVMQRQDGGGGA